jgi:hypothetical protein
MKKWTFGPLKMRPLCCLETSNTNHSVMRRHIPEERKSQLHCSKSLENRNHVRSFSLLTIKITVRFTSQNSVLFSTTCCLCEKWPKCDFSTMKGTGYNASTVEATKKFYKFRVDLNTIFRIKPLSGTQADTPHLQRSTLFAPN